MNPRTGEDVSRLVTAMVSGDRNTIAVHQSSSILNGFSPKHVSKCSSDGKTCVKQPSFLSPPRPGMTVRRHHHRR